MHTYTHTHISFLTFGVSMRFLLPDIYDIINSHVNKLITIVIYVTKIF